MAWGLRNIAALVAVAAACLLPARAVEFDVSGYGDMRAVAAPSMPGWLSGGLGKFRFGGRDAGVRVQGVAQGVAAITPQLSAIAVARADQEQVNGVDALEAYLSWHPQGSGAFGWSVKTGAFFPAISLENDDLGWDSPYTLTYSAINSWIGEELRTIGSEGVLRWDTGDFGALSFTGAIACCNDPAGILMADRGWAMDDRASGLFERVRLPAATESLFHVTTPVRTGLFNEIDGRAALYGGVSWQMAGIGKVSVLRYDNDANPAAATAHDTAWQTKFWSFGARTQWQRLVLIAQGLSGSTAVASRGTLLPTKFQSAFLLASYDLEDVGLSDWRASLRGDLFQTRRPASPGSSFNEDGRALTFALAWQDDGPLRLMGEVLAMHSRKGEYALEGVPSGALDQSQFQLDARYYF
jgi:hypothetical protein